MYGLIMARSGNCAEATEIVKQISQNIPDDAIAMSNAQTMSERCLTSDFDIVLAQSYNPGDSADVPFTLPTISSEETDSEIEVFEEENSEM